MDSKPVHAHHRDTLKTPRNIVMARRIRSYNLETRTARLKLPIKKKPYPAQIAPGIQLVYRRNKGAGVWSVKAPFGLKKFAIADDFEDANGETVMTYWQALDKARALARAGEGSSDALITVKEAVDNYEADLAARGAQKDNATQIRRNLPDTLAAKPVALLTEKELRTWRNGVVKRGLKPASADRVARVFKAALHLAAADDPRVTNVNAWKNGLKRLPDGETARNVILSDQTVSAVVHACYGDEHELGVLVETLAATGARESQVLRLEVFDLQDDRGEPRLMMPSSRKGRNRKIQRKPLPISPRLATVLRQAAAGRAPHARLLDKIRNFSERFRVATKQLGLDPDATPYALRHSSIVRMLLNGVPVRVVASHHDTSVEMIEKHYSRYITDVSDILTRRTLLDFGARAAADNVVSITGR
jgi:integrase